MKIAGTEYFTGAYNRRIEAKQGINLKKSYDKEIEKILERGQKVVDSLLLSDEGKKLSAEKHRKGLWVTERERRKMVPLIFLNPEKWIFMRFS